MITLRFPHYRESLYSVPIVINESVDPSTCVWLVPPPLLFLVYIVINWDQYMIIVMFSAYDMQS